MSAPAPSSSSPRAPISSASFDLLMNEYVDHLVRQGERACVRCGEKARASRGQARSEQRAISQRAGPQRAGALRAEAIRRAAVMRRCEICAHLQRDPAPTAHCARRCGNAACKCNEDARENGSFRGCSVRRAQHAGGAQLSGSTASRWLRRQRVCAPRVGRALLAEHREQSSHCDHTS